jgi:hypothetical protein
VGENRPLTIDENSPLLGLIYGALLRLGDSAVGECLASLDVSEGLVIRSPVDGQCYRVRLEPMPPPKAPRRGGDDDIELR